MNAQLRKIGKREFTHGGETYVYRFEQCDVDQVQEAKSWWLYCNGLAIERPGSYREVVVAGANSYLSKGLCHVLWKKTPEGIERVPPETVRKFIESLKAKEFLMLEKCRDDFFLRSETQSVESILRIAVSVRASRIAYGETQPAGSESANESSANSTSDAPGSTSPENPPGAE
jgi:hypothetical protein